MSSEPTRRFQRSHERPRTAREITADVDPEQTVRLGESRYHDAIVFPDGSVLGQCSSVDADTGTLQDAANRGLRPCKSCGPVDYLADPDTEDVVTDRSVEDLEADLETLSPGDAAGLTWTPRRGRGPVTAEGVTREPDHCDGDSRAVVDAVTHKALLAVYRESDDSLVVYSLAASGEKPLGALLDVFLLDGVAGDTVTGDRGEPDVATDGGEADDIEAAGIDSEQGPGTDGDRDE